MSLALPQFGTGDLGTLGQPWDVGPWDDIVGGPGPWDDLVGPWDDVVGPWDDLCGTFVGARTFWAVIFILTARGREQS